MNKVKNFLREQKLFVWLLVAIALAAGYYLRAYFFIKYHYDFSPYDILLAKHGNNIFSIDFNYDIFSFKTFSYPVSHILKNSLGFLNNFYLVYFAAAITIFFFGKEFGRNIWGGVLAVLFFTLAPENLLQYTKGITPAGVNYVLSWLSLLFFFRCLKKSNDSDIFWFVITSLLAFMSYHTGAAALAVILAALLFVLLNSKDQVDSKLIAAILGVLSFYIFWLMSFDIGQISLIRGALFKSSSVIPFALIIGGLFLFSIFKKIFDPRKFEWLLSSWTMVGALIFASFLVLSDLPIFNGLLGLGVNNYFSSNVTLNNYLAQALVGHIYLVMLIWLWLKFDQAQKILLSGWMIGLVFILGGLVSESYFARIFDYSFPLIFIIFGYYWIHQLQWRKTLVTLTLVILFISQLMIFSDPFSMRRYYLPEEVEAAQLTIDKGIKYRTVTDLRTAALFKYLGAQNVDFLEDYEHQIVFYHYDLIKSGIKNRLEKEIYLIVGESMKSIVYGVNFQTTPLDDDFYQYFDSNFEIYFDAGYFKVYKLK